MTSLFWERINGEWLKEWARYLLTTENTDCASAQRFLEGFLRAQSVSALRGENAWQAHTMTHS
jgi:hypothetical protein